MHPKYNTQTGLTLLEMMIVIAIIGLLMMRAVPSYQRYTQRAKFIEVIQAVEPYKIGVTLCAYQQGDLETCGTPGKNNIPNDFKNTNANKGYIDTVTVSAEGVVTATSQRIKLDKKTTFTYTLKPIFENAMLQWVLDDSAPDSCKHYHLC
jgi:prepilin-type N-terminal cleavage/methylation domain-containing protein